MDRLEHWSRPFRGFGEWLASLTNATYRALGAPGKLLQDLLNGSWFGHSTHALLTDVVVGAITSLLLLDAVSVLFNVGGLETAETILLGFAVLSALGAALAGVTDHKDTAPGDEQSLATLHGVVNLTGTAVYLIAFIVRLVGGVAPGRWLSLLGFIVLSGGAFVGGHLTYKYGVMVNNNAFARGRRAKEFTAILPASDLPEAAPTKASLGPTSLVLVRRGDLVWALKDTCSHAGALLSGGTLVGQDAIQCPLHGSIFRLSDGAVRHGPATTRQVAYQARINEGQVEVQGPIG